MKTIERRWRLILGGLGERTLGDHPLDAKDQAMQQALDYVYNRAYSKRGFELAGAPHGAGRGTPLPSALDWLRELPRLFPEKVCETIREDALDRFGMHEILTDAETLRQMPPSQKLLESLMMLKGKMSGAVLDELRRIIAQVTAEITERLRREIHTAFGGRRNRFRRSHLKVAKNFDWQRTIRANLKHYDQKRSRLVINELFFSSRIKQHLPWDVVLCVDQSGSMADSVIYSAVMASILGGLPGVNVHLIVFDDRVVDLTPEARDPVEVLMTVQLGGGTNIGGAMAYCEGLVVNPHRTVLALISDFYEGVDERLLLAVVKRMATARMHLIGLAALTDEGEPDFDRGLAEHLAALGMRVGAMTPRCFAHWLAEVMDR